MTAPVSSEVIRHDYRYFDSVRVLASQAVLLGHGLNLFFPTTFMRLRPDGLLEGRTDHFVVQNLGVGAFFVISGYLVTSSAMRTHKRIRAGFRQFLIGRFRRIYGPLASLVLVLFVVENAIYPAHAHLATVIVDVDVRTLIGNLLLMVDHPLLTIASRLTGWRDLHVSALGTAAQLWTVFVEWWIYVLFGAVYFSLTERRITPARIVWALIALPVPAYWLAKGNALPLAWLVGMAFALYDERARTVPRIAMAWTCMVCILLCVLRIATTTWSLYAPFFLVPASVAIMTAFYAVPPASNGTGRSASMIRYFSDRSYSLYLVHLSVLTAVVTLASGTPPTLGIVTGILGANVIAGIFHRVFERRWLPTYR